MTIPNSIVTHSLTSLMLVGPTDRLRTPPRHRAAAALLRCLGLSSSCPAIDCRVAPSTSSLITVECR